jgi:hypothetical protein
MEFIQFVRTTNYQQNKAHFVMDINAVTVVCVNKSIK